MIDKQINTCEFLNICQTNCSGTLEDTEVCHCYELYKQLKRKEQECEKWKLQATSLSYADTICALEIDLEHKTQECDALLSQLDFEVQKKECLEQECEELKKYLNQIRDEELSHLDIEWDEYETSARQEDYSNIITLVERALGEIDD